MTDFEEGLVITAALVIGCFLGYWIVELGFAITGAIP